MLTGWKPPLNLIFRRAPVREGWLKKSGVSKKKVWHVCLLSLSFSLLLSLVLVLAMVLALLLLLLFSFLLLPLPLGLAFGLYLVLQSMPLFFVVSLRLFFTAAAISLEAYLSVVAGPSRSKPFFPGCSTVRPSQMMKCVPHVAPSSYPPLISSHLRLPSCPPSPRHNPVPSSRPWR